MARARHGRLSSCSRCGCCEKLMQVRCQGRHGRVVKHQSARELPAKCLRAEYGTLATAEMQRDARAHLQLLIKSVLHWCSS